MSDPRESIDEPLYAVTMAKGAAMETIRAMIWAAHAADEAGKVGVYEQLVWAIGRVASADVSEPVPHEREPRCTCLAGRGTNPGCQVCP